MRELPEGYLTVYMGDEEHEFSDSLYHADTLARDCGIYVSRQKELACGICTEEGELVAAVWVSCDEEEYAFDLAVKPEYQGKGIARVLLNEFIEPSYDLQEIYPDAVPKVDVVNPLLAHALHRRGFAVVENEPGHWLMMPAKYVKSKKPLPPLLGHNPSVTCADANETPSMREHVFHRLTPYKLSRVANSGEGMLIAPSMAITDSPELLSHYGDIVLVAHYDALSHIKHKVFTHDIYSPIVPKISASLSDDAYLSLRLKLEDTCSHYAISAEKALTSLRKEDFPLKLSLRDQLISGELEKELFLLYAKTKKIPISIVMREEGVTLDFIADSHQKPIIDAIKALSEVDFSCIRDPFLLSMFKEGIAAYLSENTDEKSRERMMFSKMAFNTYFSTEDSLAFSAIDQLHYDLKTQSPAQLDWWATKHSSSEAYQAFEQDEGWFNGLLSSLSPSWWFEHEGDKVPFCADNVGSVISKAVVNNESGAMYSLNMIAARGAEELHDQAWKNYPLLTCSQEEYDTLQDERSERLFSLCEQLRSRLDLRMTTSWTIQELFELQDGLKTGAGFTWMIQDNVVPVDLVNEAVSLIEDVTQSPGAYMEMKMLGGVPLSSFHTAITPNVLPLHLVKLLEDHGVKVHQQTPVSQEYIARIVKEVPNVDKRQQSHAIAHLQEEQSIALAHSRLLRR